MFENFDVDKLYKSLESIGFDSDYVNLMLPDWWDDACWHDECVAEGLGTIARRLNLKLEPLYFKSTAKFKKHNQADKAIIGRVVELILFAIDDSKIMEIPASINSDKIDRLIASKSLSELEEDLNFFYDLNIPVAHFNMLPKSYKRPQGCLNYSPIIIINFDFVNTNSCTINLNLSDSLRWDKLSQDNQEYLKLMLGLE